MSHDDTELKSGYKTTEFWVTLLTSLVSIAMSFGYLTNEQATELAKIIVPVSGIIVSGLLAFKYTDSRTKLKK